MGLSTYLNPTVAADWADCRQCIRLATVVSYAGTFGFGPEGRMKVGIRFHHESLDVYQTGLEFMRWFVCLPGGGELSDRLCRS